MEEKEDKDEINGGTWKSLGSEGKRSNYSSCGSSLQFWCLVPQSVGLSGALKKMSIRAVL